MLLPFFFIEMDIFFIVLSLYQLLMGLQVLDVNIYTWSSKVY